MPYDPALEANLLVGHGEGRAEHAAKSKTFPAGFVFEPRHVGASPQDDADWASVGFADFACGDYRLTEASKYCAAASDGKALGADIRAIEAARSAASVLRGQREDVPRSPDADVARNHVALGMAREQ